MTASFPAIAPTSRQFDPGDWPVKRFNSQNGAEVRILYGNRRVGAKLSLSYQNIDDATAQSFAAHYYEQLGTFKTFALPQPITNNAGKGWKGDTAFFNAGVGARYRYEAAPSIESVRPGISSVSINLVSVGQP